MRASLEEYGRATALALSVIVSLADITAGADCVPQPVATKIRNVTLPNGSVARGVALSVGTPAQEMAFAPRWPINSLFAYGIDGYCEAQKRSPEACITWRGGQYDNTSSSSRGVVDASTIYEPNRDTKPRLDFLSDTIKINDDTNLSDFPLGIPNRQLSKSVDQDSHGPLSSFGLGRQSTILKTLKGSGKIGSRTWSMFYGWMGENEDTQRDGTFVFGGYDKAKVDGKPYTSAMSDGCETRMVVNITDLTLNFPNGTDASLFGRDDAPIVACIAPSYPVALSLSKLYGKMEEMMGAQTSVGGGLIWKGEVFEDGVTPYAGDLTIKLESGLTIRIPNHQLVQPDRVINQGSGKLELNDTKRVLSVKYLGDGKNTQSTLGKHFLAAAYLMANLDTDTFTLWEAKATDQEDLVAVDEQGKEASNFCTSEAGSETTTQEGPSESPSGGPPEKDGGLTTGAIAGIAVGVVAAAIIFAVAAFVLIRRRRRGKAAELPSNEMQQHYQPPAPSHELAVAHVHNSELYAPSSIPPSSPFGKSELSATPSPQMLASPSVPPQLRYELP